ncbi:MAG: hypothetical protein H6631_10475 [Anaerolineaceae bacterium]|nr:hypothetical protein [Anaerolineaceae bacterium]
MNAENADKEKEKKKKKKNQRASACISVPYRVERAARMEKDADERRKTLIKR